mmetsp:Transcript_27187/g.63275  ORF Transcript_27187/g.63275 Transcript_27187/m.63275 type:complete len:205 (+) Transcript_27187:1266-1880(+)
MPELVFGRKPCPVRCGADAAVAFAATFSVGLSGRRPVDTRDAKQGDKFLAHAPPPFRPTPSLASTDVRKGWSALYCSTKGAKFSCISLSFWCTSSAASSWCREIRSNCRRSCSADESLYLSMSDEVKSQSGLCCWLAGRSCKACDGGAAADPARACRGFPLAAAAFFMPGPLAAGEGEEEVRGGKRIRLPLELWCLCVPYSPRP